MDSGDFMNLFWRWYKIENILWSLAIFNLQNGSEIVSLTLSLFSKYMSLGFSKPLSNWFICKLLSVLSTYLRIQFNNWSLNSLFRKEGSDPEIFVIKITFICTFEVSKVPNHGHKYWLFITWNASHLAIHTIKPP